MSAPSATPPAGAPGSPPNFSAASRASAKPPATPPPPPAKLHRGWIGLKSARSKNAIQAAHAEVRDLRDHPACAKAKS